MITSIPKTTSGPAHWLVSDPRMTVIDTRQFVNRSGAQVTTFGKGGIIIDNRTFPKGKSVAISLPVGLWKVERSDNGATYTGVTTLDSVVAGATRVNLILDGSWFPAVWGRYTKL